MAEICNIGNLDEADLEVVTLGNLDNLGAEALRVLPGAELNGGNIQLLNANAGSSITGFWFEEQIRVADGFSFRLTYDASDGDSDGFAIVFQNEKLENTVAGAGENLGFSLAFDDYFAIGVDLCNSRPDNCDEDRIRVEGRRNGGTEEVFLNLVGDLQLNGQHEFQIDFIELPERVLTISIDDNVVLQSNQNNAETDIPAPLTDFLNDSVFAFVGVSGSNTEIARTGVESLDLTLTNLDFFLMNSNFRLDEIRNTIFTDAVEGDNVVFELVFVDTCNVPLGAIDENSNFDIVAKLIPEGDSDEIEGAVILNAAAGTANINFITPENLEETWSLDITVDGVRAQRNPIPEAVSSEVGNNGLGVLGLSLLITLLVVLVLGVILVGVFTKRYRDKLKKNKEDIIWGEAREKTRKVDAEVDYQEVNPMIASLDEIQDRLAKNEKTLAELRAKQGEGIDGDKKVADLQAKNKELRIQMADLKKKNEFAEAVGGQTVSSRLKDKLTGSGKKSLDFEGQI